MFVSLALTLPTMSDIGGPALEASLSHPTKREAPCLDHEPRQ